MNKLASWWRPGAPSVLGLDLQASGVRLIELSRPRHGEFQLRACGSLPCEPGWVVQGHIHAFDELAQGLRQLVQDCKAASRDVVMGVPASCIMTRTLYVDARASDAEVSREVSGAVQRWVDQPLDELLVDHCRLDEVEAAGQKVVVVVSRRDPVHDRLGLAEAAGLRTVSVDLEAQASGLALMALTQVDPRWHAHDTLALLEVEAEGAHLQWMAAGELLHEADFSFAPLREVRASQGVEQARQVSALVDWAATQLYAPWSPTAESPAAALVVAGTGPLLTEVAHGLQRRCPWTVHLADPFELAASADFSLPATWTHQAAGYLRAFGLAINGTLQ